MNTEPATPPPRRKWHLQRWLLLLAASPLAYAGWTQYAYYSAIKEAEALSWQLTYTDPAKMIWQNWKAAFEKDTWLDGVTGVSTWTGTQLEQHQDILQRLNPKSLGIYKATNVRDLSGLKGLTRLNTLVVMNGPDLTNVDMLQNLPALKHVYFSECTALTNVDALKTLTTLHALDFYGSHGLTKESIEALSAALPNTRVLDNITLIPELQKP